MPVSHALILSLVLSYWVCMTKVSDFDKYPLYSFQELSEAETLKNQAPVGRGQEPQDFLWTPYLVPISDSDFSEALGWGCRPHGWAGLHGRMVASVSHPENQVPGNTIHRPNTCQLQSGQHFPVDPSSFSSSSSSSLERVCRIYRAVPATHHLSNCRMAVVKNPICQDIRIPLALPMEE